MKLYVIVVLMSLLWLPSLATAMSCPMKLNTVDDVQAWREVNDVVMGGRSTGQVRFNKDHMVFSGVINTNGGGFSSIRMLVEPEVLAEFNALKLRVKSDGRAYKVTLRTNARLGWREVSFQAPLKFTELGQWEEVTVPYDALEPSVFGRPVRGVKFDAAKVQSLGVILADGRDGPFSLSIEEVGACK